MKTYNVLAMYSDSAFSGIGVLNIEHGIDTYIDCITYPDYYRHHVKVNTTKGGRDYIRLNNKRYYLDQFLRV